MPKLCSRGKQAAKAKFKVYPSAYANAYASQVCKGKVKDKFGKRYADSTYVSQNRNSNGLGLNRWFEEKWVNICEPKPSGGYKSCGRMSQNVSLNSKKYPYCRPSVRINKQTPKTVKELTKSEIRKRCSKKRSVKQGKKGKPTYVLFSSKKTKLQKSKYPFLSLSLANKFKPLAKERGVSKVARGVQKSTQSDMGFMQAYAKVNGRHSSLKTFPVKKSKPEGQTWLERRESFCARHLAQMRKNKRPFFETSGKYKGTPTRQHLGLIMWAYSPYPERLRSVLHK